MDDFSFYKSAYDNELVRRDNLDNAVNPPIVVLTVLIGAISYLLSNIDLRNADNFTITILVLVGISALAISIAIFFLARSYNNLFMNKVGCVKKQKREDEFVCEKSKIVPVKNQRTINDGNSESGNFQRKTLW